MQALRHVRVGCAFSYEAAVDTAAIFQVQPHPEAIATVTREAWYSTPELQRTGYRDLYSNVCHRLTLPVGPSQLRYDAVVMVPDATEAVDLEAVEVPAEELPDAALVYTLPSRYVLPDVLADQAWELFASVKPGYRRVAAICEYVNGHVTFSPEGSTPLTTAADVQALGKGVCRDFAHLAISFCRALNIPARYVFGYLPEIEVEPLTEPMDFAAWMEVYLDGAWWTFDPRNNEPRKGRVLIGRGRDALDVAMVTTFGGPVLRSMEVWAQETSLGNPR
jgi:transglutaminase-like putative cysteine protease